MTNQSRSNEQFAAGMTVYDSDNAKVGTIDENNADHGYIVVQKGFLFPKDLYIPRGAIARVNEDSIYLSLRKDDLSGERYSQIPQNAGAAPPAVPQTTDRDIRVPVYEEELVVGTRQVETGRVHLHEDVVEERETVSVPLQQERVSVDRVAVTDGSSVNAADAFQGRDIEVPVMGEEAVVGKQVREVEEVRLHKEVVTENQQVGATVRKERVSVDGDVSDVQTGQGPQTKRS